MKQAIRRLLKRLFRGKRKLKFSGYADGRIDSGHVEFMSDGELQRLNDLLPWMCFTVDRSGRRFGNMAWEAKRDAPQKIPDERIELLHKLFNLADKSVLEVGCFEGVHTIALSKYAKEVYAIDSRIENVVKTIVRSNLFGFKPSVLVCDLEKNEESGRLPKVDVLHHVGVLYHLKDPVTHLSRLGEIVRDGMLLDTHYATDEMINSAYDVQGRTFRYYKYEEGGRDEVFSGMYDHAKWLSLADIRDILGEMGFTDIRVHKDEIQRNGPRVTLFAARPSLIRR